MIVNAPVAVVDDERALLVRLGELLEREEAMIRAQDAIGIVGVAEEREQVTARLAESARMRRMASSDGDDAELVELYVRLRQRHQVRAEVLRLHTQRGAQAIGVLAQASGRHDVYAADGRVKMTFAAS